MPRIRAYKKKYIKEDFCKWIISKMYRAYTQAEVGEALGVTQQTFNYKLKTCSFDIAEIATLLDFFKATDEERVRLLKL